MTVTVQAGFAICGSCLKLEEVARTLAVQASDANYDRIDTVVLRLNTNDNARYCDLYVVQGIPSTAPVRPTLTRTSTIWELGLADVFVAKNSGAISTARITDTRYDATRCGVISSISEFDTTTIYNQVQADLAEFKAEEQADFLAWYERMRNQLSEDAAGSLQQQIDGIKNSILDTMEEIEANTQENQLAGANAVKEFGGKVGFLQRITMWEDGWNSILTAPTGFYVIPYNKSPNITDLPNEFKGARLYVLKTNISDDEFMMVWSSTHKRCYIGYLYGVNLEWRKITSTNDLDNYLPLSGGTLGGGINLPHITLTAGAPLYLQGLGNGTYNQGVMYVDEESVRFETPKVSDNSEAKALPFVVATRGGQYAPLKAGDIYSNDSKVLTAANFTVSGTKLTINLD